jgi:secreted trypsin-like serine protease
MSAAWLVRKFEMLAVAAMVACSACAAPIDASEGETTGTTQQAIVNGEDDDGDPAVVALLSEGKVFCTGVLLTNNVVATAAHCVYPTPPDQVYFGKDPSNEKKGVFIDVSGSSAHPDFDEDTLENDIGVVGLATKAPVAPLNVLTKDFAPSYIGKPIRLVGFGATSADETGDLHKRTGSTTIQSFGDDDFRFTPNPAQTCVGDSGGPALATFGDHEAVIGITSSGDGDCKKYGRHVRIDRYVPFIQNFAKPYALRNGPSSVESSGCSMSLPARGATPGSSVAALLLALGGVAVARGRRRARVTRSA